MAVWRKVIVSGSAANLATVQVDNLTNGYAVIGGGTGIVTSRAISGSGAVLADGGSNISLTGSFSGSFSGSLNGTASYVSGSIFTSTNPALSASYALSSSYSLTASYALNSAFPFSGNAVISGSLQITGSSGGLGVTGSIYIISGSLFGTASYVTGSIHGPTNPATSASYALSASYAFTASSAISSSYAFTASSAISASYASNAAISSPLVLGKGIFATASVGIVTTYSGSTPVTFSVSGSDTMASNYLTRWTGAGFSTSSILEGANNTITVGYGTSTFSNNVVIGGNLDVQGTASFTNAASLFIADQFIAINSGSNSLRQTGIIAVIGSSPTGMSGSAFFLDNTGNYGRWALTASLQATSSGNAPVTSVDEYVASVKLSSTTPGVNVPTWGSATGGPGGYGTNLGNIWIDGSDTKGGIYIYA